jgi:FtsP/CotA-like multicopper oxidase with cupredoxin domain
VPANVHSSVEVTLSRESHSIRRLFTLVLCLLSLAMRARAGAAESPQPPGWDASIRLATVPDMNPDPRIVEVDLVAKVAEIEIAPGERVRAWTYNGSLPGPLIRARVGDRLIVHFTNNLEVNTTVHWHGVRVPNAMDGVPEHTQPAVFTGKSFTYDFEVNDAGLFWYHPHVMSAAQVGFGLYGALLVDDPEDGVGEVDEAVLVLSDIALTDGEIEAPDSGGDLAGAFGREGTKVLLNGRADARMIARESAPQRWRIVNAAKSRYFFLDLEGVPFTVIGTDGGLQASAERRDALAIAPGERLDVLLTPERPKDWPELTLRSGLINRGFGSVEFRRVEQLMTIAFSDLPRFQGAVPMAKSRAIAPLELSQATNVAIDLTFSQGDGLIRYGIGGRPFADERSMTARVGETQIWTVNNKTNWSHPFHLHGFFFQLLDERGTPVLPLAWKDTVDVPFHQTVRFAVRFDDRPGMWMYHCHILDHADLGLMGMLQLLKPD